MTTLTIQSQTAEEANTLITGSDDGQYENGTHFPAVTFSHDDRPITRGWVKTLHMFIDQPGLIDDLNVTGLWAVPIEYVDSTKYSYITQDSDTVEGKKELVISLQPPRTSDLLLYCDQTSGNDNAMLTCMVEQIMGSDSLSQCNMVIIQRWITSELCISLLTNLPDEETHKAWRTVCRVNEIDDGFGQTLTVETASLKPNNAVSNITSIGQYATGLLVVVNTDLRLALPEWTTLSNVVSLVTDMKAAIVDNKELLKADMDYGVFAGIVDPIIAPDYTVSIEGDTTIGSVLTATVDLIRGATGNPAYQWLVNDVDVPDATGEDFTLTSDTASVGDTVTVTVTGINSETDELDSKTSEPLIVSQ